MFDSQLCQVVFLLFLTCVSCEYFSGDDEGHTCKIQTQAAMDSLEKIESTVAQLKNLVADLRQKIEPDDELPPTVATTCPSGFTYLPSAARCYKAVFEKHDWYSAGKKCQQLGRGSHLAAITSAAENSALKTFLASELSKNAGNTAACEYPTFGKLFWTSGQQQIRNNCRSPFVWRTSSGKELPLSYTSWVRGEPNCGGREQCLHIWVAKNFGWNDGDCIDRICPLCEYKPL